MTQDQQQKETDLQICVFAWWLMHLGQKKTPKEMQTKESVKATQGS